MSLTISNVTPNASNTVLRTFDLTATNWFYAGSFMTNIPVVQWSETIINSWTQVFYRIMAQ